MAGRPKKMARIAEEIEDWAIYLAAKTFLEAPRQYVDRANLDDPIGRAWWEAVRATMLASITCERLGILLRAKAGIPGPGPAEEFCTDPADATPKHSDPPEGGQTGG